MKKYMFVVPSLSMGGAERVVSVLANALATNNNKVGILIYYNCEKEYHIDDRVQIFNISKGNEEDYNKLGNFERYSQFKKALYEFEPTHILPFVQHVNIQTWLYCMFTRFSKRVIYTVRNSPYNSIGIKGKLHDYLINHKNISIVQNQEQKKYFNKSSQKRIFVLPNPVNDIFLKEESFCPRTPFCVVSSGRLTTQKNFPMLIEAFKKFSAEKNDVVLNIYGEGTDKEMLQRLIDKGSLSNKIRLMGRTNDLVTVYKSASLFVLPSNFEGMPNALLEAMAIGLPCISTDCPTGPSEMIENGENGLLVPVNDAEKMREAIEYMYNNREKAEKMGKRAREFVSENYRIEKIVDGFLEIVDQK